MKNYGLVPLSNFADMGEGVYRAAQPLYNYQFKWVVDTLNVGTTVNLRSERHVDERYNSVLGFDVYDIEIPDHAHPTDKQVEEFKEFFLNRTKPILIHCCHGHGRTTTFCVLVRLFQGWTLEDALKEQEDLGFTFRHINQLTFLRKYYEEHCVKSC